MALLQVLQVPVNLKIFGYSPNIFSFFSALFFSSQSRDYNMCLDPASCTFYSVAKKNQHSRKIFFNKMTRKTQNFCQGTEDKVSRETP